MGREEIDVIRPALEALRREGFACWARSRPTPPSTRRPAPHYDAILCMYHDQALIPVKTLDFHGGINVSLGLPFIRTSPDHGTALGIAGRGIANPEEPHRRHPACRPHGQGRSLSEDLLPPLREVIARHGLAAKKALGQNFLFDLNLTRRIARAAGPLEGVTVIEVGPGPGGLTRALLMEGATELTVIERDARAIAALEEIAAAFPGRLTIIEGDAMEVDYAALAAGRPAKIVANLPYNIATPLLVGWLTQKAWPPFYQSLTLMFQKEVAERIVAKPGGKDFGRLSVLSQYRCEARKLFDVNRSAFTPPPKVTSSIVQLVPRPQPQPECRLAALERVTAAAFGQRRKMLRASLKSVLPDPEATLAELGIDPQLRAEQLPVEAFARWRPDVTQELQPLRELAHEAGQSHPPGPAQALRAQDGLDFRTRRFDVVVDDHIVIFRPVADLVRSLRHALGDGRGGILCPPDQPVAQLLSRGRQDEDPHQVLAHRSTQLLGALPVDVEEHVAARLQGLRHRPLRRAVEIAENLCIFQKLAAVAEPGELLLADEVIILAVHLARPRRPRRDGHRHGDVGVARQQPP